MTITRRQAIVGASAALIAAPLAGCIEAGGPVQPVGISLHDLVRSIDLRFDGVNGLASAYSPTGDPYYEIAVGKRALDFVPTDDEADELIWGWYVAFGDYAAKRPGNGRLYWRTRPDLMSWKGGDGQWNHGIYSRQVITDKPA